VFVQLASQIVLSRLLNPEDLGLVTVVTALTGFAPLLIDLGTRDAAVQKQQITEGEVSALFWLTVGMGTGFAILLAGCSSLIATVYADSRLQAIALCSSTAFVFSSLSCQHLALMRRTMMFQKIAVTEVGSNVVGSAVAVAMALMHFGYWALVAKPIVVALFTAVACFSWCRWVPGIPKVTPGVKEMLKFGVNLTGFTFTDYIGRAMDRIILAKRTTATEVGLYQNALFVYDNALSLLSISLHSVAVASLSKLRDDLEKLRRSYATALSAVAFFAMPIFAIMAVTGRDIVVVVLGDKWSKTGLLVELLAIRGIPHVVERTLGWLHVAGGRADRWMRWGILSSAAHLVALFCGLSYGTVGVAIAYAVTMYVLFVPALAYAGQPLGIGARDVLRAVGPQLVGALASVAMGYLLEHLFMEGLPGVVRAVFLTITCLIVYLVVVVGIFQVRKPLQVARTMILDVVPARLAGLPLLGARGAVKKD